VAAADPQALRASTAAHGDGEVPGGKLRQGGPLPPLPLASAQHPRAGQGAHKEARRRPRTAASGGWPAGGRPRPIGTAGRWGLLHMAPQLQPLAVRTPRTGQDHDTLAPACFGSCRLAALTPGRPCKQRSSTLFNRTKGGNSALNRSCCVSRVCVQSRTVPSSNSSSCTARRSPGRAPVATGSERGARRHDAQADGHGATGRSPLSNG
jgi:hypothetical protein